MYIHASNILNIKEDEVLDTKEQLKQIQSKPFRRTDRFIQLALLGAHKALLGLEVDEETALYLISGQGDLAVFNRLRETIHVQKQAPKPVDFINSLSNTAGFYVAQSLKLHSKNLSLCNQKFGVEMGLLLAQNNLSLKSEKQILIGGVDELLHPLPFTKKLLGLCGDEKLGEGSNWLLLNSQSKGSIASIEILPSSKTLEEILVLLEEEENYQLAFGFACEEIDGILKKTSAKRYAYEKDCDYYETLGFYVLSSFIQQEKGTLIYLSSFNQKFQMIRVKV